MDDEEKQHYELGKKEQLLLVVSFAMASVMTVWSLFFTSGYCNDPLRWLYVGEGCYVTSAA